jgi:cytosine/adenosine deaminase-related metal-dependent hydrolase
MDLLVTDAAGITQDADRTIPDRSAAESRGTATLEAAYPDARGMAVIPGFAGAHAHAMPTVPRAAARDWCGNAVSRRHVPGVFHHVSVLHHVRA